MDSILKFCFCILRPGLQIPKLKIQIQIKKNICILYLRPGQPEAKSRHFNSELLRAETSTGWGSEERAEIADGEWGVIAEETAFLDV